MPHQRPHHRQRPPLVRPLRPVRGLRPWPWLSRGPGLRRCWQAPALLLSLLAAPVQAGSVTAESVWDQSNAIQRAQSQVPAGATVTRNACTVVNVRTGNDRYICTVYYTDAPAAPAPVSPPAPAGAATAAP